MRVLIVADAPGELEVSGLEYDAIIVLDGAVTKILNSSIIPNYIIGDMDTAPPRITDALMAKGALVIKTDDQKSTDLDKGIIYADNLGATKIDIVNAVGGRMDHTLYNVRILKKYYRKKRPIIIHTANELLEYYADCELNVEGAIGSPISVMSSPEVMVYSRGLKYDMDGLKLTYGARESSSNSLATPHVKIKLIGEALIIYNKNTLINY